MKVYRNFTFTYAVSSTFYCCIHAVFFVKVITVRQRYKGEIIHVDFCVDLLPRILASKDAHFPKKMFSFFLQQKYQAVVFFPSNFGPEKLPSYT